MIGLMNQQKAAKNAKRSSFEHQSLANFATFYGPKLSVVVTTVYQPSDIFVSMARCASCRSTPVSSM